MRSIKLPANQLEAYSKTNNIEFISLDSPVMGFSASSKQTAKLPQSGSSHYIQASSDIAVAVLDSGVAESSDIDLVEQVSMISAASTDDSFGHGTHVAGIIGGDSSFDEYDGTAPGAKVYSVRVLDENGQGLTSDVIAGLEWVLSNAETYDIRVVNLSLGKAVEESAATDPLVEAVEQVWDAGIVVVASAGNYGRDGNSTITSPGNSPKVITVGSVTDKGTGNDMNDDFVSTYSSQGPTLIDHYLKPDLLAPGNRLIAPISNGSKLKGDLADRVVEGEYLELSGTSMAAGMVSGAAVLMLSDDPSLSPDTVKARLMRSARKISGDLTSTGAGVLDINAALNEAGVMTTAALSPKLTLSENGDGVIIEDTGAIWGTLPGVRLIFGVMLIYGLTLICGVMLIYGQMLICGVMLTYGQMLIYGLMRLKIVIHCLVHKAKASI